jgi:tetratricopeptide (TPR) repeat protein
MIRTVTLAILFAFVAVAAIGAESISELKAKAESSSKAAAAAPSDYVANWTASKACQKYAGELVNQEVSGWKETAKAAAKDAMKYGDIAIKLNEKGVEGWYWYGVSVGSYSDCVSILTALGEGLKGKTQKGFETSYSLDKSYDDYGPVLALGRFWQVLPSIAGKDLKKAEQLFNEYVDSLKATPDTISKDVYFYFGELYKEKGKKEEAKASFKKAADQGHKKAARALAEMK